MIRRWPLHPPPRDGEALASWLRRLAESYGLSIEELIRHDLVAAGATVPDHHTGALDLDPPGWLLSALVERTGTPLDRVRQMTIAGWVPWLLDPLDPEPVPGAAFDTYVRQVSVLLTAKERPPRAVPGWRAWLPTDPKRGPLRRACPACHSSAPEGTFGLTLISQLPVTLSCPHHSSYLEPAFAVIGAVVTWETPDAHARPAPAAVVAMDARTHEALSTGVVLLPRRPVHVGVWFRMLRSLIDELTTPVSSLRTGSRRTMARIWEQAGHPPRAGIVGPWRPYEALPWPQQQMVLEAAAEALHLIEAGEVPALDGLLRPAPHRHVPEGTPPPAPARDHWQEAMAALDEATGLARNDPSAARQLLFTLTALTHREGFFQRVRDDLIALGVPADHLPHTLASQRAPAPPTAVSSVTSAGRGTVSIT
ncbi:MAG: TniQ family protein [Actinobacteria bacterium]|nr:TniQ family protein [Actinomycetota bacterium]